MKAAETVHSVHAWNADGNVLEYHNYRPGRAGETAPHIHDTFQICLSLDFPGEYRFRGASHRVPVGAITVIQPGEVHAARDPLDRDRVSTYRMMYVPLQQFDSVSAKTDGEPGDFVPVFQEPVILDASLAAKFLRFHMAFSDITSRLATDEHLLDFLGHLVTNHSSLDPQNETGKTRTYAIELAREYLDAYPAEDVSLQRLASLAHLSPFHFARSFRDQVGMPPHAYAIAVRIDRAKTLLTQGMPSSAVASETGFADQAHLIRHFKRIVGSTPARYTGSYRKNVQDS